MRPFLFSSPAGHAEERSAAPRFVASSGGRKAVASHTHSKTSRTPHGRGGAPAFWSACGGAERSCRFGGVRSNGREGERPRSPLPRPAAEERWQATRTPRPRGLLTGPAGSRQRLGVRQSSAALVIGKLEPAFCVRGKSGRGLPQSKSFALPPQRRGPRPFHRCGCRDERVAVTHEATVAPCRRLPGRRS